MPLLSRTIDTQVRQDTTGLNRECQSLGVRVAEPLTMDSKVRFGVSDWQPAVPAVLDWLGFSCKEQSGQVMVDLINGRPTADVPTIISADWKGQLVEAGAIRLLLPSGKEVGTAAFPTTSTRRIPPVGAYDDPVSIEPYAWLNEPEGFKVLIPDAGQIPAGSEVVLKGEIDGTTIDVAWRNGVVLYLGFPLFELLASELNFEPLEDGFYLRTNETTPDAIRRWLLGQISSMLPDDAGSISPGYQWPSGSSAGMTIRLDHDRPVDKTSIEELIRVCDRHGARISGGFLNRKPDADAARLLHEAGHELLLHTEAGSLEEFRSEVDAFHNTLGTPPRGYTAHGGRGSRGWLGQQQWQWAIECGMLYGEMLGRQNRIPHHAVIRDDKGMSRPSKLVLPGVHLSLDAGMRPEAHNLEQVRKNATLAIEAGEHVVLMNHPDIHRPQLYELLEHFSNDPIWHCTFLEMARRHASRHDD